MQRQRPFSYDLAHSAPINESVPLIKPLGVFLESEFCLDFDDISIFAAHYFSGLANEKVSFIRQVAWFGQFQNLRCRVERHGHRILARLLQSPGVKKGGH